MLFAKFISNHRETAQVYYSYEEYQRDTFDPNTELITFIVFVIHGKDYKTRKESLRTLAVEWSNADIEGIFASDLIDIQDWFEKNGKRYGLLEEFRENAIC